MRVLIEGQVLVYTDRGTLEGRCVDLSLGGIMVWSAGSTATHRLVALEAFFDGERVRLDAELVRGSVLDEGHALAFRFVDLDSATREQLQRIIRDRLARSSQPDHAAAFAAGAFEPEAPAPTASPIVLTAVQSREDYDPAVHTVVADALPTPVVSGQTHAIALDADEPEPEP
ncbi:MAG: PilZ domain-containing protein, partial [Deltaproteobacteria bacterium]|nr:PilZ domain-containing protein [Deltaproteobacteria bacterium]